MSSSRLRVRVPEAHSPGQQQIMEAFVTPHLRECWVACGTKYGKSLSGGGALNIAAPIRPQTLWRWVAPIYQQAKVGLKYVRRMLPTAPGIIDITESGVPTVRFTKSDTAIEFWHGQQPESLEGEATAGNIIDEASKQKEQVYASVKTTTTQTGGIIVPISTPRGKNWFYRGCMKALEEMERAKFENRPPRYIYIHAPTYANPFVPADSIEEMRRSLPNRLFKQYVEAEFLDDGSVFLYLAEAFGKPIDYDVIDHWIASTHDSQTIYVGADWAKMEDSTVFVALNDKGELVGFKRFNRMSYPLQIAALYAFCDQVKANSMVVGCHVIAEHDQTGIGEAINDSIMGSNPGIDITGVKWTNQLKETYISDLILSFEEQALKLKPIHVLKHELDMFEVETTLSGRVVYSAPEGQHDDTVMAMALANRLFRSGRSVISNVAVVDYLNNIVRKAYFNGGDLEFD